MLRGNLSACVKEDYSKTDLDEVVACFKDFLLDVAGRTPRMNEAPLRAGIMHAFERVTASEAELCANRLFKAFQYCQDKARSATSGKKLQPATFAVVKAIQGTMSGKLQTQKTKSMEAVPQATQKTKSMEAVPQAPDPPRSSNTKMASPELQTRKEALPQRVRCRSKTPETKRGNVDSRQQSEPGRAACYLPTGRCPRRRSVTVAPGRMSLLACCRFERALPRLIKLRGLPVRL